MDPARAFRSQLARRIFSLMALAAPAVALVDSSGCGGDTQTGQGGASTQSSSSLLDPSTGTGTTVMRCFAWPQAGTGGAGGAGGTMSSTSGAGGAGGTAGAGGTNIPPCPDQMEALNYIPMQGCGSTVQSLGTFDGAQCCYTVFENSCATGRPYLDGGEPVMANALQLSPGSSSWTHGLEPNTQKLSAGLREKLQKAWTHDALGEHASIASFGRFALELMAVGAPAELLEAAHQAALDEIQHARLCFALASAYAGQSLAPSGFPFEGTELKLGVDLADIAQRAAREGCIGETLAAVQAAEQCALATDPALKEALARIAEDEARHAELAYKTVAWAIKIGGKRVKDAVAQVLSETCAPSGLEQGENWEQEMLDHGRLSPSMIQASASRVLREIVRPALMALVGSPYDGERQAPGGETCPSFGAGFGGAFTKGPQGVLSSAKSLGNA